MTEIKIREAAILRKKKSIYSQVATRIQQKIVKKPKYFHYLIEVHKNILKHCKTCESSHQHHANAYKRLGTIEKKLERKYKYLNDNPKVRRMTISILT